MPDVDNVLDVVLNVGTALVHAVPLDVKTLPEVLGATVLIALVPFQTNTAFALKVLAPDPPFATGKIPVTA